MRIRWEPYYSAAHPIENIIYFSLGSFYSPVYERVLSRNLPVLNESSFEFFRIRGYTMGLNGVAQVISIKAGYSAGVLVFVYPAFSAYTLALPPMSFQSGLPPWFWHLFMSTLRYSHIFQQYTFNACCAQFSWLIFVQFIISNYKAYSKTIFPSTSNTVSPRALLSEILANKCRIN